MLLAICLVALLASGLTLVSGFGLGTLLTPAFALFFPVPTAVAMTATVHLANNLFKIGLVGRDAHWPTLLRFGLPATLAAFAGAWLLGKLAGLPVLGRISNGRRYTPSHPGQGGHRLADSGLRPARAVAAAARQGSAKREAGSPRQA